MIFGGLDIETTGLEFGDHRIIEICVQLWDLDTAEMIDGFDARIHPQRSILAEAQRVHGISLADLDRCDTWDLVGPRVRKFLERAEFVVAHNGVGFDMPFVEYEFKRIGEKPFERPCFDTMLHGRGTTHNGKSPTLGELCFGFGIEYDPSRAHAASYDVSVMCRSFMRGVSWGHFIEPLNNLLGKEISA